MRRILLALIVALLTLLVPATARASTADATLGSADISQWMAENGATVVRAHGSEAFPEVDSNVVADYTVGTPVRSWSLSQAQQVDLVPTDIWVAPIYDGENAVGALSVDFSSGEAAGEKVYGDPRLGTEAADTAENRILVHVAEYNDAWFIYADGAIGPASEAGANVILGEVPFEDFLAQVVRSNSSTTRPTSDVTAPATTDTGPSIVQSTILALVVIAVVVVSILWLRWDHVERKEGEREDGDESRTRLHTRKVSDKSKVSFKESAGKVDVYERPVSVRYKPPAESAESAESAKSSESASQGTEDDLV